jgi:hypothetical protein
MSRIAEVFMPLQEFILELAKWTAVFSLLTLVVHLLQTRIIKEWRVETNEILKSIADAQADARKAEAEAHKEQAEAHKEQADAHRRHEEFMMSIHEGQKKHEETLKYIAGLIAREGEKTRETIKSSF